MSARGRRERRGEVRRSPELGGARSCADACLIYGALLIWTFIALFPLYWTLSTSFKLGQGRHAGPSHPVGRLLAELEGMAVARTVARHDLQTSNVREEFLKKFVNSVICSVGASALAVVIGSLAAYGLSRFDYKFGALAQQGHFLLLPVAAHPAAGGARRCRSSFSTRSWRCSTPASASSSSTR